ncbi:hypothetical protein DYB36_009515 [Aphanomyces astaci]|uniref:Uncharacterized protein n=1 Tax=Aphanomyces astaci TaxID=112090 RepID=A0A397FFQ6_APHAT|nr:hypothetical protein DYB36_009515 [Aphanomyces astaci]RHZ31239.1 hypothetical protein DYB31_006507 [Aphanomyces astaci]
MARPRHAQRKTRRAAKRAELLSYRATAGATITPSDLGTEDGPRSEDSDNDTNDTHGGTDGKPASSDDDNRSEDQATPRPKGAYARTNDDNEASSDDDSSDERVKPRSSRINFRHIVVSGFDPSRGITIEAFLQSFDRATETYAELQGVTWTDRGLGALLYEKLEGAAAVWAANYSPGWSTTDFYATALKRHLVEEYSRTDLESINDVRVAMSSVVKQKSQTWSDYANFIVAAQHGYALEADFLVTCFEKGLPLQYAEACNMRQPTNVSQAARVLQQKLEAESGRPTPTLLNWYGSERATWPIPLKPPWLRRKEHRWANKAAKQLLQLEAASRRLYTEHPHGIRVLALRDIGLPTWTVDIGGVSVAARVDSCSTLCVGNEAMADVGTFLRRSRDYVEGITGNVMYVTQVRRVTWTTQGGTFVADVHVVPGVAERLLLGSDFKSHYGMSMQWATRELHFPAAGPTGVTVPFTLEHTTTSGGTAIPVRRATVATRVKLPAMCGGLSRIQVAAADGTDVVFTPYPGDGRSQVLMAATVATVHDGFIAVPAVNTTCQAQRSREREAVGLWTPLSHELQVLDLVDVTMDAVDAWLNSVNADGVAPLPMEETIQLDHLNDGQEQRLLGVLRRFPELTQVDAFVLPAALMGQFVRELTRIRAVAKTALDRAQADMARLYNKDVRDHIRLRPGMLVWIGRVSRSKGVSKLKHRFRGPARLVEDAGFDNWRVECLWDKNAPLLVHSSECLPYFDDGELQQEAVLDTVTDGEEEDHLLGWRTGPTDVDDGTDGSLCQVLGLEADGEQRGQTRASARQKAERTKARQQLLDTVRNQADWCGIRRSRRQRQEPLGKSVMEVEVYSTSGWRFVDVDTWEQERQRPSGGYWVPLGARNPDVTAVQLQG